MQLLLIIGMLLSMYVKLDKHGNLIKHLQNFRHQLRPKSRQVLDRDDHWGCRQDGPHAHSAHFWKGRVFIPDLGENAIFQYTYDKDNLLGGEYYSTRKGCWT